MSIALENLRRDTRTRLNSDQIITPGWILVPLLEITSAILYGVAVVLIIIDYILTVGAQGGVFDIATLLSSPEFVALTGIFSFVIFVLSMLFAYLLYKLIKRRNAHFARQLFVYEDLTKLVKELSAKKGADMPVSVNNLERTIGEARSEETEKNAVLWVILTLAATTLGLKLFSSGGSFLPTLATLYIFYFLTQDFFKHERREDRFVDEINRTLAALGLTPNISRRASPIPSRNFVLYTVLTIVTVGFFGVYWVYTLINDPNYHFRHQAMTEDAILAQATQFMA